MFAIVRALLFYKNSKKSFSVKKVFSLIQIKFWYEKRIMLEIKEAAIMGFFEI